MSTRYNDGSHYENHERAALALEHSRDAHHATQVTSAGHGIAAFGHHDIAVRAHELWQARGCPEGSPQEDWFRAAEELRSRAGTHRVPVGSDDQNQIDFLKGDHRQARQSGQVNVKH